MAIPQTDGDNYKSKLIAAVKKEVKQIMEEAVTKKFVHEESGSVTSLCGAVEACLSQGLRRRALGLFKTSSTTALLHKVAKHSPEAAVISQKVQEIENSDPNRRSSSSGDSMSKPTLKKVASVQGSATSPPSVKYLWIRLALFDKQLAKIIDHLASHANRYYEKDALVADPDYGSILSSLLVGPCALDYSRTKTPDHFWSDPPADELVQRHRISSGHATPPSVRRPILNFRRSLNASSEDSHSSRNSTQHVAKDYVESLHQNSRATLLYGKNNVLVLPASNDITEPMPGYLSLHQTAHILTIKWTPNQLMNGFVDHEIQDKRRVSLPILHVPKRPPLVLRRKSLQSRLPIYWDYALQVRLDEVVYVHCHQDGDTGGTVILVGQDGVQRPPIHFPKGGHMLAFLSCLETGLLPHGRLDPPLWSQRVCGYNKSANRSRRRPLPALADAEQTPKDYVFRIVDNSNSQDILKRHDLLEKQPQQTRFRIQLASSSTSSESSTKSLSIDQAPNMSAISASPPNVCIQQVCNSMKRQIISRAFYGWLAYCRHLSTVRTHLSGLVMPQIVSGEGAAEGLTIEKWDELKKGGIVSDSAEVYRLTYFGGVAQEIRKEVWPYLLGHYKFGSSPNERTELYEQTRHVYENTMSEWLAVEAIVRQRDKENTAASIAKLSSESTSGEQVPPPLPRDLSNDVFEDMTDDDSPCHSPSKEEDLTDLDNPQIDSGHSVIVTNPSVDIPNLPTFPTETTHKPELDMLAEETVLDTLDCLELHGTVSPARSACVSPASSNGGVYSTELLETFGLNLHRIDKDVQRCDRNYWYFSGDNLDKLRNVMCTYVWEHLDVGYMQGMCDLVAPLLVILDDESETYACFCHLMERMIDNFPNGGAMDNHFANMRSLIQILDAEMYELMHSQGDYTHFYFCYRWFLLDFKRELLYADVNAVWETIWAAQHVASSHFVLFLALALLETYRDIILSNNMDFTDIIKFFNEMAERHNATAVLSLARDLALQLQLLIENK